MCPQDAATLSLEFPGLQTNQEPKWPGLQTLLRQLPPQDSGERYCLALGGEELPAFRLFCAQRRQEALGQGVARPVPPKLEGHTCEQCREPLRPGEPGVFATPAGQRRCWHPACFTCRACGQALADLIYFHHDGHLYCGRHHAELLRPRCPACDQLIFSPRCTEAEGRRWHENHFCCQHCAGPLGGGRYALPGGGPCCPRCFESRYSGSGSTLALGRTPPGGRGEGEARRRSREACPAPAPAARSGPGSPGGRVRAGGPAPGGPDPHEDDPCPTCSSSSDSEPEGVFLGRPLPGPRETPGDAHAGDGACRRHCTVS
ncbi:prickle-like protein 4 [Sorex fumeus]|uniref:prickle-like protein 4 n=1 Tax=Sorex fumeus TaxID=62283 RepID=UPI0024ACE599|nr:prickle-like protein 4 [Sorex fumeus]